MKALGKELQRSIQRDQQERIDKASKEIEERLKDEDIIGTFDIL